MDRVVLGIVETPVQVEAVVERLRAVGFSPADVSVLFPDKRGAHDFAFEHRTKAPEGALTGAGLGGMLGALVGLAFGIGALVAPGLGVLVAAGPILAALAGAACFAVVLGALGAALGARVPEIEARAYAGKVRSGSILVAAHAGSRVAARRAREVLRSVAASDVSATSAAPLPSGARG